MSTGSEYRSASAEDLSALVDGELHEAGVAGACGSWRADAGCRATWHAYQLIGDVLRSEDLATDAARDAAFLHALSARLSAEPVVLAPQPSSMPLPASTRAFSLETRRRSWSWMGPSAVAAGFVAVAGVLVVTRGPASPPAPQIAASAVAAAQPDGAALAATEKVAGAAAAVPLAQAQAVNGQFIRDAGLDHYLAAHKRFAGSTALGVPSGLLRSATVDASGR